MEEEIFRKTIIVPEKLLEYGFKKEDKKLVFEKEILNNTFKIVLTYNNIIKGKIIDLEMNEEYINYRQEKYIGEFVSKIRKEYLDLLKDIKDRCTIENLFIYNQTNRINNLIKEKYNSSPEFLWDDDNAVYRNKNNKKWYGIIMPINKNKIDKEDKLVEVINIKLPPELIVDLLKRNGFYKAYHMNKKNWITIILDDTLKDNDIIDLIDISYKLVDN